jgi:uncharacterized membrane protein YjgN (DUF898 family)
MEQILQSKRKLKFHGTGASLFGIMFVNMLLTVITLGIYAAWAHVANRKYFYQETELEGTRFEYHAKGIEVFIGYLKAFGVIVVFYIAMAGIGFLSGGNTTVIITAAIILYLALFALIPVAIHGSLKYEMAKSSWRGIYFGYRGDLQTLVIEFLKGILLTLVTFTLYSSWFTVNIRKYITGNLKFGSISFSYEGDGSKLFFINLKGFFLTLVTFGIYFFWYIAEVQRYHTNNTKAFQNGREIQFKSDVTGGDVFGNSIVNMLLIIFTLGIAFPWVICREVNFMYLHLSFEGDFRADELQQTERNFNDATGDGLANILDIGI